MFSVPVSSGDDQPVIKSLYVYPTYAVCVPQRERMPRTAESLLKANEARALKRSQEQAFYAETETAPPVLSQKATRRLVNAVNWLVASAKEKTIFDKKTGKKFSFKVNFVTLTLPTTDHGITDHFFKSVLLHNFINTCRHKYKLQNFIWKVECQENGNIHAHFTTDTFVHWRSLRSVWNTILQKNGIIEKYQEKHAKMSFDDYKSAYGRNGKVSDSALQSAFSAGCASSWSDPNTTDVHAVHKVSDIAAYLAKYMGKSESDRRRIKGRVWSSSYSLSAKNKLTLEILPGVDSDILCPLHDQRIKWKPIQVEDKVSGRKRTVGEIFFFKQADWGGVLNGRLLNAYNDFRFKIRSGLAQSPDLLTVVGGMSPPKHPEVFKVHTIKKGTGNVPASQSHIIFN